MIIHDRQIKKFCERIACSCIIFICVFGGEYIYQNQLKKDIDKNKINNTIRINSRAIKKKIKDLPIAKSTLSQP